MLESLLFLSGPSKKIQSQLKFLMRIQNRYLLYPNQFSLKKLQWSTVRGKAICQSLKSVNNAKQTALCGVHLCFQTCSPLLCTHPGFTWRCWWPEPGMVNKESWPGGWFLTSENLEDFFFLKQNTQEWLVLLALDPKHRSHPISKDEQSHPVVPSSALFCKGFYVTFSVREHKHLPVL